ncbi:MAG: OmpA family protein [Treponema sp.]|nr:OmpA family protein [Treponema sp.]
MKKLNLFNLAIFALCSLPLSADEGIKLEFKYKADDNFSLISTVEEDVKYNGRLNHHAQILSRVTERLTEVDKDGRGHIQGTFMTSEESSGLGISRGSYKWGETFESDFWRDKSGRFEIDKKYFMPVIRDLPVFPDKKVKVGDEWNAEGYEAEDLRRGFGIEEPFHVPFVAKYKYERDEKGISSDSSKEEKTFQVITANYSLYYETPVIRGQKGDYPVTTMGYSNRTIWWDNEKGQIDHYTENFRIVMETSLGNQYSFTGTTNVEVTEFKRSATEENVKDVMQKVEDLGLEDISVTKTEKGLTISLENIQFLPDSAVLQESEMVKIQKIGAILNEYEGNDLLIAGHTARAGSEESCQLLSEERASAVADFLVQLGVRQKKHIFTQGFGSKVPVASNKTERGKAKNRRVEITILDK